MKLIADILVLDMKTYTVIDIRILQKSQYIKYFLKDVRFLFINRNLLWKFVIFFILLRIYIMSTISQSIVEIDSWKTEYTRTYVCSRHRKSFYFFAAQHYELQCPSSRVIRAKVLVLYKYKKYYDYITCIIEFKEIKNKLSINKIADNICIFICNFLFTVQ